MSGTTTTPTTPFSFTVPFVGKHSSIVIGSKGKCIKSLQQEFRVNILAMKADSSKNLPVPYFLIEGNERDVLFASLKVHSLLSLSMGRTEKELKSKNDQLTMDNEELIAIIDDKLTMDNEELIAIIEEMDTSPSVHTPH